MTNMRSYIQIVEGRQPRFLYKGISSRHLPQIMQHGVNAPSYWGTQEVASYYAMEASQKIGGDPVILKVALDRFDTTMLDPDNNSLDTPLLSVLDYDESEIADEWENSEKDWTDSLRIVGAVVYRVPVTISDADVIYPDPDDLDF